MTSDAVWVILIPYDTNREHMQSVGINAEERILMQPVNLVGLTARRTSPCSASPRVGPRLVHGTYRRSCRR